MKKLLMLMACLSMVNGAFAWGQKGHDVTAYIAECHLTKKAAAKVTEVLEGHSPVYYANWMDSASHTPEFAYSKTWHYFNIDEGYTYENMPREPKGDVVKAVKELCANLKSGKLSKEEENIQLKFLIHLVGDMHCPMHAGRKSDRGGNMRPVKFFSKNTSLHSAWDTDLPESIHKWSYTEWQQQIDRVSKSEEQAIAAGTPDDWMKESHSVCTEIYNFTPEGTRIAYDYMDKYAPVIEKQFLRAGLRLARLLNEIYD